MKNVLLISILWSLFCSLNIFAQPLNVAQYKVTAVKCPGNDLEIYSVCKEDNGVINKDKCFIRDTNKNGHTKIIGDNTIKNSLVYIRENFYHLEGCTMYSNDRLTPSVIELSEKLRWPNAPQLVRNMEYLKVE